MLAQLWQILTMIKTLSYPVDVSITSEDDDLIFIFKGPSDQGVVGKVVRVPLSSSALFVNNDEYTVLSVIAEFKKEYYDTEKIVRVDHGDGGADRK